MNKYILFIIVILFTGCSSKTVDYATKNCDIAYKGKCYFKKRISEKHYDELNNPGIVIGDNDCYLITPDVGCVPSSY